MTHEHHEPNCFSIQQYGEDPKVGYTDWTRHDRWICVDGELVHAGLVFPIALVEHYRTSAKEYTDLRRRADESRVLTINELRTGIIGGKKP